MSTTDLDPDNNPHPPRQRWQDELEEILAASDRESTPVEKVRGKVASARYQTPEKGRSVVDRVRESWSGAMWVLLFVGLILLTFVVQHFSPLFGRILALIAVAILIALIVRGFRRPSAPGGDPSRMWRGKDMSFQPKGESWFSRLFRRRE